MDNDPLVEDLLAIQRDPREIIRTIHAAFEAYRGKLQPESGALCETVASLAGKAGHGVVLGVIADQRVAACVCAVPSGESLYLDRLAVHPDFRRRGLAHALVAAVEAEARRRHFRSVTLGVRLALESNIAFFSKLGFVETGRSTHAGFEAPTSMDMEKPI
jgi:ribosomal protein S18 acetylase RimI-like enzyme